MDLVEPSILSELDPSAYLFTNSKTDIQAPTSPQEIGQLLASSWTAEVIGLLIAAGADIAAVDAGVKSALAHALDRGLEVLRRAS